MNWVAIKDVKPMRGTTVLVFTPVVGALRYRIVSDDLLKTCSEATHWAYLEPPDRGSWYADDEVRA